MNNIIVEIALLYCSQIWWDINSAGLYQTAGNICHSFDMKFSTSLPLCSTSQKRDSFHSSSTVAPEWTNLNFKRFQLQCASRMWLTAQTMDTRGCRLQSFKSFWRNQGFRACHLRNSSSAFLELVSELQKKCVWSWMELHWTLNLAWKSFVDSDLSL